MNPLIRVLVLGLFAVPAFGSVTVSSPANNATITSPAHFVATAASGTCKAGVASMGIYVNNTREYVVNGASMNTTLAMNPGTYYVVVEEWDKCGGATTAPLNLTVAKAAATGVSVTSPASGSSVPSPIHYVASATTSCAQGVASMGIYVNNTLAYVVNGASLNTELTLNPGTYNTVVQEWDHCGSAAKTAISLTVTASSTVPTSITVSPDPASFAMGATQQFTATAKYSNGTTANITSSATWSSANTAVATVSAGGLATGVASGLTNVTASLDGVTGSAPGSVTIPAGTGTNVSTWHYDTDRSGLNPNEASLTPANVTPQNFGMLFSYLVDGYVYGQPLLQSGVTVNGATHNVVYAATENDSVYAFDADSYGSGTPLWKTSLLKAGEAPMTTGPIQPVQGVTSTPVIDPSTNTIYVVSAQQAGTSAATFRLNALDITTGAQKFGGPVTIQASVPATNSDAVNGVESLTTKCLQRSALLLANGNVYIGFGSCHSGWLLAYSAGTLAQVGVFNVSPNLNGEGTYASAGGVWMGGGGPVADSAGNIYITTGNGPWDGLTAYSDSVIKFSPTLQLEDYFTPVDYQFMDCSDSDLASGGLLMLPGTSQLLAGGKMGRLYLVDSSNMGHEQANDAGATQTLWFESDLSAPYAKSCTDTLGTHTANVNSYEIFGTGAYYNNYVYLGMTPTGANVAAGIRQFGYTGTLTPGAYTSPSVQENTKGTTPFISSDGTTDGIVWMIDTGQPLQNNVNTPTAATLRAYDADNFPNEIYNSSQNAGDTPGYGIKFSSPMVANGKVYISTGHDLTTVAHPQGEINVYGLK